MEQEGGEEHQTAYAVPAGPAGQMDSPGHPAESRGRLRGQHHGGSTRHRRKRRVRTVPETLPHDASLGEMQTGLCALSTAACPE